MMSDEASFWFSGSTASSSSATTPPAISLVNDEMLNLASEIHSDVSNLIRSYSADRDRLKAAMEQLEYQVGLRNLVFLLSKCFVLCETNIYEIPRPTL